MPNWTSNIIRVEGTLHDLRAFLDAVKGSGDVFDFNRIIPMPEILRHTSSGFRIIDGKEATSWYVVKEPDHLAARPEEVRPFTDEEEALLAEIGHRDWYSWSNENWGTKWNACRAEITESCMHYGYIEIRFDTAWDAPLPVFHRLLEIFPALGFTFNWQHEGESLWYGIARDAEAA